MDKQHILDEIRRTAEANGGVPLGKIRFEQETGIREVDWSGELWAKWSDALAEAGYAPNQMQGGFDDERLIRDLIFIIPDCHAPGATGSASAVALPVPFVVTRFIGSLEDRTSTATTNCQGQECLTYHCRLVRHR